MAMKEITPFGIEIKTDSEGRVCLTDLWKASGSIEYQKPVQWKKIKEEKKFIVELAKNQKVGNTHLFKSTLGVYGETYAHRQIALRYAQYLSPKLAILVQETFFERLEEEKDPQLAIDRAVNTWKKKGKTDSWIGNRLISKAARNVFTGVLGKHGVEGSGYRICTNSIYTPLLGGSAEVIRVQRDLPEKSNLRDHMSEEELLAVLLSEKLASKNIESNNIKGNSGCAKECLRTSNIIAEAVRISLGTR